MPIRSRSRHLAGAALALLALSACVPRAAPPAPLPAPAPAPRPVGPAPPPAAPPADWQTSSLSPGDWSYGPSDSRPGAFFGSGRMRLMVSCLGREVSVDVLGAAGNELVIRTSYGERRFPVEGGDLATVGIRLAATDPLLDRMAFSRGRFLVAVSGGASLVVPAWPEFARVIEDCRGQ